MFILQSVQSVFTECACEININNSNLIFFGTFINSLSTFNCGYNKNPSIQPKLKHRQLLTASP